MNELVDLYGPEMTLDHCILGQNLNLGVIRGFARLDALAAISSPDVFDQHHNPQGTQRELNNKHAREATDYAVEAASSPPDIEPRAFTEVILNARDRAVLSVVDSQTHEELDFSSTDPLEAQPRHVSVRLNLRHLTYPPPSTDPQISRVDGNHRLSQLGLPDPDELDEFPVVPFALFVGLSTDQERALFRDINGTQQKMETAHLDTIQLKLKGSELLKTEGGRSLWLAQQLAEHGRAFEGKVFFGGSKKGPKQAAGSVPPVKINALKGAVAATLREIPEVEAELFNDLDESGETIYSETAALQVLALIDRYWKAVARAYPLAWQDRSNYILLQSIGLTAFARLGAAVIRRQLMEEGKIEQEDFNKVLDHVAGDVPLDRDKFPGLAGLAGAKEVYKRLSVAMNSQAIKVTAAKKRLQEELGGGSPLDGD